MNQPLLITLIFFLSLGSDGAGVGISLASGGLSLSPCESLSIPFLIDFSVGVADVLPPN